MITLITRRMHFFLFQGNFGLNIGINPNYAIRYMDFQHWNCEKMIQEIHCILMTVMVIRDNISTYNIVIQIKPVT